MNDEKPALESDSHAWDTEEVSRPRPSIAGSYARGAVQGMRGGLMVGGVWGLALVMVAEALMAFAAGSGRGWGVPEMVGYVRYIVGGCVVAGGVVGLLRVLFTRFLPERRRSRRKKAAQGSNEEESEGSRVETARVARGSVFGLLGGKTPLLVVILGLLVVDFVVAFGVGMYVGRRVDEKLARAEAEADRQNPQWRFRDLMAHREEVPEGENSGRVVAEAVSLMPEGWPNAPRQGLGFRTPDEPPVLRAYNHAVKLPPNERLAEAEADVLRHDLRLYQEAVRLARSVKDYERGRHEIEDPTNLFEIPLKETQDTRGLVRLLEADVFVKAHDGDLDGALESCRAILGLARSIGAEPFAISQLVRLAIDGSAVHAVERVLAQGEPSDEALARLQADVLREFRHPFLAISANGERAMTIELFRRIGSGELTVSELGNSSELLPVSVGDPSGPGEEAEVAPWFRLQVDHQIAVGLEWFNDAVEIAGLPRYQQDERWRRWKARIKEARDHWFARHYSATLPVFFMPSLPLIARAEGRVRAALGSLAILLAAERQRQRTGAWPEAVGEIKEELLSEPPRDPYSGKPFLIDRQDGEMRVHSIGPNGQDQHGLYTEKAWPQSTWDDVGVRAWDVSRRAQEPGGEEVDPAARSLEVPQGR